jgi:hypothetical protein
MHVHPNERHFRFPSDSAREDNLGEHACTSAVRCALPGGNAGWRLGAVIGGRINVCGTLSTVPWNVVGSIVNRESVEGVDWFMALVLSVAPCPGVRSVDWMERK